MSSLLSFFAYVFVYSRCSLILSFILSLFNLDSGFCMLKCRIIDSGFWTMDSAFLNLDSLQWILEFRPLIMIFRSWIFDSVF